MVPFAIGGWIAWGVVGLGLFLFGRDWMAANHHDNWLNVCLAGFLLGFPGTAAMIRHDIHRKRRRETQP